MKNNNTFWMEKYLSSDRELRERIATVVLERSGGVWDEKCANSMYKWITKKEKK